MTVCFVDRGGAGRASLQAWRAFLLRCGDRIGAGPGELTVLLCGDEEMARLNERFRGRRGPTDVLSFPDHSRGPDGRLHLGDIALSLESAGRQARERDHGLEREVRRLLVHGLLHVFGYDHETDGGDMAALERDLLSALDTPTT